MSTFPMVFIDKHGNRHYAEVGSLEGMNYWRQVFSARECHVVGYEPKDVRAIKSVQGAI